MDGAARYAPGGPVPSLPKGTNVNQIVKTMWVDALRSGKFEQGRNTLRVEVDGRPAFCCLGVLTEIAVGDGVTKRAGTGYKDVDSDGLTHEEDGVLTASVQWWAGLPDSNPFVNTPDGGRRTLSCLNDDEEYDFEQIADVIEEQL